MKNKIQFDIEVEDNFYEGEFQNVVVTGVQPKSLSAVCPHCSVFVVLTKDAVVSRSELNFDLICHCPNCTKSIFTQVSLDCDIGSSDTQIDNSGKINTFYPAPMPVDVSDEVPTLLKTDFIQAAKILYLCPKASAAMSRRILQTILREKFNISKKNLYSEIEEFVRLPNVPSYLTDALDAVRQIGNIAAHPSKNQQTGEIIEVEQGEAEWLIEAIDSLLDFAYVQPVKLRTRKEKLNEKLRAIGKPEMEA